MRWLWAGTSLILLACIVAWSVSGSVTGQVTQGYTNGVPGGSSDPPVPCPKAVVIVTRASDGVIVAKSSADALGHFHILLWPGQYRVVAIIPDASHPQEWSCERKEAKVKIGRATTVDLTLRKELR